MNLFQKELMTDFTKDFIEYGEKNKSHCKDIDSVMTKICQITDDPLKTSKSFYKNVTYNY